MANVLIANLIEDADGYAIGYEIRVFDATNGEHIEEYMAGNNSWESMGFIDPTHRQALTRKQLGAYMDITADEMSREHNAAVSIEDPYRLERDYPAEA
jgi:hypothetical protein